jgi:hypothetical protein
VATTGVSAIWRGLAEFMLVGGATFVLLPLGWLLRSAVGLGDAELAAGFTTFYAAYVINDPHFSVTYLLFYRNVRRRALGPEFAGVQRARYLVSGFMVPLLLIAWAAFALHRKSGQTFGGMVQLMYLLVGWHYVKQGFGVLSVLCARRGVRLTVWERRASLFHAFSGWAYAWANPAMPAGDYEEKGVVYRQLAHPRWFELTALVFLVLSATVLGFVLLRGYFKERRRLPLVPLSGFLVTVWLWTIYSGADPVFRYLIPALHALQYFYFVWLMRKNEARAHEGPPSFGRPVAVRLGVLALSALGLGFLLFRAAPTFFDDAFVARAHGAPVHEALGATPYFAAFFVVVNVHHYFMDHVIWRRENPETKYLQDVSVAPEA